MAKNEEITFLDQESNDHADYLEALGGDARTTALGGLVAGQEVQTGDTGMAIEVQDITPDAEKIDVHVRAAT